MPRTFDNLDYKILSLLYENARRPFLEIARECNVSGAAIHQRVAKLIEMGAIKGFDTKIDPEVVGFNTCAYVGLHLKDADKYKEIVDKLEQIPEIVECHYTTGKYDIFIKIFAQSNEHLLDLIHDRLQPLGVSRTESLISFKEVFRRNVPIPETIYSR